MVEQYMWSQIWLPKASFQKIVRVRSLVLEGSVQFDCQNPNPALVGSRFDFLEFLEVQRFKVGNFLVRNKTNQNVT